MAIANNGENDRLNDRKDYAFSNSSRLRRLNNAKFASFKSLSFITDECDPKAVELFYELNNTLPTCGDIGRQDF